MQYQPIEFPDGTKIREEDLDKDSFGKREWDKIIQPNLPKGNSFLDIGCNAGIHLVLADFKKKYGIDRHHEYLEQCKEVLDKFSAKAKLIHGDIIDIKIPKVDVALMSKALHWVGYSDEGVFIDNYEDVVAKFLKKLSKKTDYLLIIGVEGLDRIGGSLEKTLPYLKDFEIIKSEKIVVDRPLNIILCKKL